MMTSYPVKLAGLALLTRRLSLLPYRFTATQYYHFYYERNRDEVVLVRELGLEPRLSCL